MYNLYNQKVAFEFLGLSIMKFRQVVENITRIGGQNSSGSLKKNAKDLFLLFSNQTERGIRRKELKSDMNSSFFTSKIQLATQLTLQALLFTNYASLSSKVKVENES